MKLSFTLLIRSWRKFVAGGNNIKIRMADKDEYIVGGFGSGERNENENCELVDGRRWIYPPLFVNKEHRHYPIV